MSKKIDLDELFWDYEQRLLSLGGRIYFLKAYEGEISKRGNNSPLKVRNHIAHQLIVDMYRMTSIDTCSFLVSLFSEKKSLFRSLRMYTKELGPEKVHNDLQPKPIFLSSSVPLDRSNIESIEASIKKRRKDEIEQSIRSAMIRVFGEYKERISPDDLEAVRVKKTKLIQKAKHYRDHIAHRLEKRELMRALNGHVKKNSVEELVNFFEESKTILNDMRFIYSRSTLAYSTTDHPRIEDAASGIVDLMTFGSIKELYYEVDLWGVENSISIDYDKRRKSYFESKEFKEIHLADDE